MKGSIRASLGFLVVFGAVGSLDNGPSDSIVLPILLAICGLVVMYSGVTAMNKGQY